MQRCFVCRRRRVFLLRRPWFAFITQKHLFSFHCARQYRCASHAAVWASRKQFVPLFTWLDLTGYKRLLAWMSLDELRSGASELNTAVGQTIVDPTSSPGHIAAPPLLSSLTFDLCKSSESLYLQDLFMWQFLVLQLPCSSPQRHQTVGLGL